MVDFTPRADAALGPIISGLIDDALVKHTRAEYEKTRGSGVGDVAYKRIGAGYAGMECIRALAYRFHKFPKEEREGPVNAGELQRHAESGHWTERKTAEWLKLAGFTVRLCREDGSQFGWTAALDPVTKQARMAGQVDGMIVAVPETLIGAIATPCIWESKKATDKKWKKFQKEGVAKADPVYYGQLQLNMAYMDIWLTLFSMLNLDTMKYLFELVRLDQKHAQFFSDRALSVIQSANPGQFSRLCRSEDDFCGKYCDWHDRCFSSKQR